MFRSTLSMSSAVRWPRFSSALRSKAGPGRSQNREAGPLTGRAGRLQKRSLSLPPLTTIRARGLRHNYVRTGDRIRSAADTAFQQGVFSQAGGIYRILLQSGITGRRFQEPLSFDTVYLRGRIGSCSKALMELGLVKYRQDDSTGHVRSGTRSRVRQEQGGLKA
jgi:hypothetical protein